MSKLTKIERKVFYKKLLEIVCADPGVRHGFCFYLYDTCKALDDKYYDLLDCYLFEEYFIEEHLPELWTVKPDKSYDYGYWFARSAKGWETRINLLFNIIQKM